MIEQPRTQNEKNYWQKPENLIATFTMIAVLTYTGVQIWQTCLIRSNNVVSQRAFISIASSGQFISVDNSKNPVALNFLISATNSGNTATQDAHILMKCAPSAEELQEPWAIIHQGPTPFGENTRFNIGPHSSESSGCSFPIDQAKGMADKTLFGYIMVDISYLDRMDKSVRHRTQKSLKLWQVTIGSNCSQMSITDGLIPVGQHNCADDECPQ